MDGWILAAIAIEEAGKTVTRVGKVEAFSQLKTELFRTADRPTQCGWQRGEVVAAVLGFHRSLRQRQRRVRGLLQAMIRLPGRVR